jgi:hypothetical protein
MAVVLDFTQSGSGSTKISAQPADIITFELNETVWNNQLAFAVNQLNSIIGGPTGVSFVASSAGAAGTLLSITQSGSGSTSIAAENGDTITLELSETVFSNALTQTLNHLKSLFDTLGITFAVNTTGGAT